jgi:hypothetical protein
VPTVLIAASANLNSIKQRGDFPDAMAFADTDALRALEAITRHRPNLVVLESAFAATSRGTALMNRIKADPSLAPCEIRVLSPVTEPDPVPVVAAAEPVVREAAAPTDIAPAAPIPVPVPVPDERAAVATQFPLDAGTRRVPRFEMAANVEVLVDGNPAALINLSLAGAQLVSPTTLKPNQRVRVTLPVGLVPIRVTGEIAWAMFEMPQSGPQYRAGLAFIEPDTAILQRLIETHGK